MRADGWQNLPIIRMTNISLSHARGRSTEIIGDTKDGVYMDTNQSWSIDDKRVNFQFGCEIAWRIKEGRLTDMYRNPNYTGITTEFWGSCDAVGGHDGVDRVGHAQLRQGPAEAGRPRRARHAPARFRNVRVGVR